MGGLCAVDRIMATKAADAASYGQTENCDEPGGNALEEANNGSKEGGEEGCMDRGNRTEVASSERSGAKR